MENMRAHMYARAKDWLLKGGIPTDDENLAQQLCLPGHHINRSGRLVLESKADLQKRGEAGPDDANAFALTFARPVAPVPEQWHHERRGLALMTGHDDDTTDIKPEGTRASR